MTKRLFMYDVKQASGYVYTGGYVSAENRKEATKKARKVLHKEGYMGQPVHVRLSSVERSKLSRQFVNRETLEEM